MAKKSTSSALLLLAALVAAACLAEAARPDPVPAVAAQKTVAASAAEDVKRPDTFQEGTVLIPGIGRYEIGSHYIPDITGLDHSIPAAVNGQYMPGADDTWVPNPGFEVPNPFRPGSANP